MDHVCGIAGEMLSRITMTTLLLEARLEGIKLRPVQKSRGWECDLVEYYIGFWRDDGLNDNNKGDSWQRWP